LCARISRDRLDRELTLRGWTAQDLVRASGISAATISAARQGKPVRPGSIHRIVTALLCAPVLDGIAQLLDEADAAVTMPSRN
jgi:DNA-binding Xre family transcriptional regulator